ncbi:MAG: ABC transporter permease, partial [Phycisphaerae bacterium]
LGHRAKIEAMDPDRTRILAVSGIAWIGGRVEDSQSDLSTLATSHDNFFVTFPEYKLTDEQRELWMRERRAIILGEGTAGQYGWEAGDHITIQPSVPPYSPMEFVVVATSGDAADRVTNWIRLDYLLEAFEENGIPAQQVSFFYVKCASHADLDHFRTAIDAAFAGSTDETLTQDEKAFMSQFIVQQFNLPQRLSVLAAVTVFAAVMAAANTMSMTFRDRISEFATLKSLGFGSGIVFAHVQTESIALCLLGGIVGTATPYCLFTFTPLRDVPLPVIQSLHIDPGVCGLALATSLGIGIIAAIWPSWSAVRLSAVQAFRTLE